VGSAVPKGAVEVAPAAGVRVVKAMAVVVGVPSGYSAANSVAIALTVLAAAVWIACSALTGGLSRVGKLHALKPKIIRSEAIRTGVMIFFIISPTVSIRSVPTGYCCIIAYTCN
jgi:hypothetical protein